MVHMVPCPCKCGGKIPMASYRGNFGLSEREAQIADLAVNGYSQKELCAIAGITRGTLAHHLVSVFDKVGCDDRLTLMLWAHARAKRILDPLLVAA